MSDSESCPHMTACAMYRLFAHTGTLGAWKALYCTAEYSRCVRYQESCLGHHVPVNLLPTGQTLSKASGGAK